MAKRFTKENIKRWWKEHWDEVLAYVSTGAALFTVSAISSRVGYKSGYCDGMINGLDAELKLREQNDLIKDMNPRNVFVSSATTDDYETAAEIRDRTIDSILVSAGKKPDDIKLVRDALIVEFKDK